MKIKDIMSYNVVTIPSNTSIAEAKRIMTAHKITRLPVVDRNKLVGIVTSRMIESVSPSKATSLSIWEVSYLLEKTTVKEIMAKEVFTVSPDMDAEAALAGAQKRKYGSAVVVQDDKVVGIVTTTDFFNNILSPLLGIGVPGDRVEVTGAIYSSKGPGQLEKLIAIIRKFDYKIHTVHIEGDPMKQEVHDVCFHIFAGHDLDKLLDEFRNQGYQVRLRDR
jgi:acetoin utilization protein AcuB